MTTDSRKDIALEFLRLARAGDRKGTAALFTANARHHNAYFPAGMPALLDGIAAAAKDGPERPVEVKRVVEEGDIVVVHSHVRKDSADAGYAVVHMLRFEGRRIAELWDLGQEVPAEPINRDGMF